MKYAQISLRFYIKGDHAVQRAINIKKIAKECYGGNLSKMVNECLDRCFDLNPETGVTKSSRCATGAPISKKGLSGKS